MIDKGFTFIVRQSSVDGFCPETTTTVHLPDEDLRLDMVIEGFKSFLLAAGFHRDNVNKLFYDDENNS